jgi:hypothetical protein
VRATWPRPLSQGTVAYTPHHSFGTSMDNHAPNLIHRAIATLKAQFEPAHVRRAREAATRDAADLEKARAFFAASAAGKRDVLDELATIEPGHAENRVPDLVAPADWDIERLYSQALLMRGEVSALKARLANARRSRASWSTRPQRVEEQERQPQADFRRRVEAVFEAVERERMAQDAATRPALGNLPPLPPLPAYGDATEPMAGSELFVPTDTPEELTCDLPTPPTLPHKQTGRPRRL